MQWNPKLVIALSTAVVLLGAQAKSLQAEPEGQCPTYACPPGIDSCYSGGADFCMVAAEAMPGCMRNLQFSMCSTLIPECGPYALGALCFWE